MTVGELIRLLEAFHDHVPVFVYAADGVDERIVGVDTNEDDTQQPAVIWPPLPEGITRNL